MDISEKMEYSESQYYFLYSLFNHIFWYSIHNIYKLEIT